MGATAFVVCHGNLLAREAQQYISQEPLPIVVDARIDPAALETFNGASDTPEPRMSAEFKLHLEAMLGDAANAECHLSESVDAARSLLEFWQGQFGSAGNPPPQLVSWAPPPLLAPQAHGPERSDTARTKARSRQLGAR